MEKSNADRWDEFVRDSGRSTTTYLHRERDCPKKVKYGDWSAFVDVICLKGCVKFTEEAMLACLWKLCPEHKTVSRVRDVDTVVLNHWEWAARRTWPWLFVSAG